MYLNTKHNFKIILLNNFKKWIYLVVALIDIHYIVYFRPCANVQYDTNCAVLKTNVQFESAICAVTFY